MQWIVRGVSPRHWQPPKLLKPAQSDTYALQMSVEDPRLRQQGYMSPMHGGHAHYDSEVSRFKAELADIERVKRFVANFASNHKDDAPTVPTIDPVREVQEAAPPTDGWARKPLSRRAPKRTPRGLTRKSLSRWLRLSAGEVLS